MSVYGQNSNEITSLRNPYHFVKYLEEDFGVAGRKSYQSYATAVVNIKYLSKLKPVAQNISCLVLPI